MTATLRRSRTHGTRVTNRRDSHTQAVTHTDVTVTLRRSRTHGTSVTNRRDSHTQAVTHTDVTVTLRRSRTHGTRVTNRRDSHSQAVTHSQGQGNSVSVDCRSDDRLLAFSTRSRILPTPFALGKEELELSATL